jgi:hypothetical protein
MGQVLHGSATTTEAVRRAIQHSQESLRSLARRYGINQKTVAKWEKRTSVGDLPTGPSEPKSRVLSNDDEAVIVAFRRHTLLPLDDCLYCLQATIPHLTRSSLHCCLQRHGISRLPDVEGDKPAKKKFKAYPIGFCSLAGQRTECHYRSTRSRCGREQRLPAHQGRPCSHRVGLVGKLRAEHDKLEEARRQAERESLEAETEPLLSELKHIRQELVALRSQVAGRETPETQQMLDNR